MGFYAFELGDVGVGMWASSMNFQPVNISTVQLSSLSVSYLTKLISVNNNKAVSTGKKPKLQAMVSLTCGKWMRGI